jgi:hypothetical protein
MTSRDRSGVPAPTKLDSYDAADLCTDMERFSFLLSKNDGGHLLA